MKKLYFLLIFSALVVSAFGQARISNGIHANPVSQAVLKSGNPTTTMVPDTLWPPSFGGTMMCDTAPTIYSIDSKNPIDSGYAFGNNMYGELECAQKYYGTGTIDEVLVWIAHAAGTTGTNTAKIYTINPVTGGPATASGTSLPVPMSTISPTALTSYSFAPSVSVTNTFAAACVFPTGAGDTVGVVSTVLGCATSDSLSWENFPAFGGWLHTGAAFGVNVDLWIFPVGTLTNTTGINEYSGNGLSLLGAFPNPAKDFTTIQYRTDEASAVSVNVFDLSGRVILNTTENLSAGTHEIKVSLKDVAAGKYYYTVKTAKAQLTSKFVVVK